MIANFIAFRKFFSQIKSEKASKSWPHVLNLPQEELSDLPQYLLHHSFSSRTECGRVTMGQCTKVPGQNLH